MCKCVHQRESTEKSVMEMKENEKYVVSPIKYNTVKEKTYYRVLASLHHPYALDIICSSY